MLSVFRGANRNCRVGETFRLISVDLRDEKAARQALSPLADVRRVACAAIYENGDDLVSGWSSTAQIEANDAMPHNVIEPLLSSRARSAAVMATTKPFWNPVVLVSMMQHGVTEERERLNESIHVDRRMVAALVAMVAERIHSDSVLAQCPRLILAAG
jgi:hypothetical protein